MSRKKDGKITLGMLKGRPVTTSVPSISVKFHANAEQLEELYGSDEEHLENDTGGTGVGEPDNSPLKLLPRLVKRSTSIDITPSAIDASPPSDPWRFFADIKGKITKSVEDKIKARNLEEGSPLRNKTVKDSKENSSLSDSEDLSESSISKTCGIVSTTEGAEMSSDDEETPSIEKDPKLKIVSGNVSSGLRQRFRLLKNRSTKEGTLSRKSLARLYEINSDKIQQALFEENEIESGVDALEHKLPDEDDGKFLKNLETHFDNIEIDQRENIVNFKELNGNEAKEVRWNNQPKTVFAPVGFVDLREKSETTKRNFLLPFLTTFALIITYFVMYKYSSYLAGFTIGVAITYIFYYAKNLLETPSSVISKNTQRVFEIPAVKEFQPLNKYEGWLNEFPDTYNPHTYHISQTQSVFLRLQGNLLRLSHTKSKIPKRALWNESKIKPTFTHHRVYNLLGAEVTLLPEGLAKKRHWSKKYPICVTLNKDQMNFDSPIRATPEENGGKSKKVKKKRSHTLRFSKLCEENEELDFDSETSRASTPSPLSQDDSDSKNLNDKEEEDVFAEAENEEWEMFSPAEDENSSTTKIFVFGRTDREKEDWFRRLKAATHMSSNMSLVDTISETDYLKYMSIFNKLKRNSYEQTEETPSIDVQWISTLFGRVLFDCLRNETLTNLIKDKIQRKLSSIKLPYFIESLMVTELSLGHTPPLIKKTYPPEIDDRGLWIDLDITYEGLVTLILQTKLNLMKLKQPPCVNENVQTNESYAMYNSDLEDSAESTSDEEPFTVFQNAQESSPVTSPAQSGSKKLMKMVDRITESKFFQVATEYRYIKKAMEGVSNTELRLKVEVKELVGTLVLNIPAPPTDRIWIGFRALPELALAAQPIVGERNITFLRITSWIEKKLILEFQKLLVIPNMEDLIIPVMSSHLPE